MELAWEHSKLAQPQVYNVVLTIIHFGRLSDSSPFIPLILRLIHLPLIETNKLIKVVHLIVVGTRSIDQVIGDS